MARTSSMNFRYRAAYTVSSVDADAGGALSMDIDVNARNTAMPMAANRSGHRPRGRTKGNLTDRASTFFRITPASRGADKLGSAC